MSKKTSVKNKTTLKGTNVADTLTVKHQQITVNAGKGQDKININSGSKHKIYGEAGNDIISIGVKAGSGSKIYGDDAKNKLTGNDTFNINGGKKNYLYGGKGKDTFNINGGTSNYLYGGAGNDVFVIGKNSTGTAVVKDFSTAKGNTDSVQVVGGAVKNIAVSGKNMIVKGGKSASITLENTKSKTFTVTDTLGAYTVSGTNVKLALGKNYKGTLNAASFITTVDARSNANGIIIKGNAKNNTIYGGVGANTIYGYGGNDTLNGGAGNDTLYGGVGTDKLTGGTGRDTFVYANGDGKDTITDYTAGQDTLQISSGAIGKTALANSNKDLVFTVGSGTVTLTGAAAKAISLKDSRGSYTASNTAITLGSDFTGTMDAAKYLASVKNIDGSAATKAVNITGNAQANVIKAGKAGGTYKGEAGNDTLYGGTGNDKIYGGAGDDIINAGSGTNTLYFAKGDGNDQVISGGGVDTLVFTSETNINGITAEYINDGTDIRLNYNGGSVVLKNYDSSHSAKKIQAGSVTKAIADILPEPPKTPYELANMIMGTDGADTLVQTFGESNDSAYDNQLNILKQDYGATDDWLNTYRNDLSTKAHDVSTKYSNVQGVLSDISWYEYLISNYDNPNYTGDTYFKHWSKEYYIDQLAQKNADAYGLTYTWDTYRDAKLADYTEGTAEYNVALENLKYSIEYARYQNTVDKYNKYQGYADDTSAIPTFRDIAIARGYTSEDGYKYYEAKTDAIMRNLNGFKGSNQVYEELLDDYAKTNSDFAALRQNYKIAPDTYQEQYDAAIADILENNNEIKTAYDIWQADLAKYNQYLEYSQNYYDAEYLGENYDCDVEGKEYVSFRQEAEAERENKVIHDYYQKQFRYRTGQEYWSYRAELMNREINGYEGTVSRYNYFYMLSKDGNPLSIYYDLYREVRDEYNDYVDEYNTYARYINNWNNSYYNGEIGDDALQTDSDVWSGRANIVNVALSGRISEYNAAADELNGLVQYIKDNAPSETALQILTHLTTSSSGGIIIAGDGKDDITIGHIDPNSENVSRGDVFAMGQGGDDIYRLENYGREGAYGENIGITIYDHEGTNTVHLNSIELNSGNIGVYANVTLVKNPDGSYATNPDGSYQYTLENFKTDSGLSSGSWSCIERSPLKNGDAGYSFLLVDAKTYSNKYAFSYGAMDQAGIKLDTQTIEHLDKIYSNDGKYITQDQLNEMFQKTANQLAKMGYDSFMDAVEENINSGIYEKQHNLAMLTSSEVQGSLEWVTDETVNITGATEGLTGTDRNDNLTSTSANETFDLKLGNDTVTFKGEFGNDIIQSSSTVDNNDNARQADTLNLQGYSIEDRTLVLEINGNDLVLKAYADDKTTVNGTVTYKNFLSGDVYNSRKFVLNAADHTYMVWFNEAQELANQEDTVAMDIDDQANNFYNIRFIKSLDNGLVRIDTNENRSSYIVLDDTPILLFKSTNTGTKEVISYGNADDQYREALSETTDLIIKDNGGNDSLEIKGGYYETIGDAHMRYFFDVTADGIVSDAKHIIWTDNFYTPNKEEYEDGRSQIVGHSYATENLIKLLHNDSEHMKGAITIYGDIETINNDNHPSLAYDYPMSYNKVIESTIVDVVPWLNDESNYYDAENDTWPSGHHYTSVTDALTKLQAGIDAKQAGIEKINLSGIQYDENKKPIPETIPAEYTQLKTEQDAIQAKIDELLSLYNKNYETIINTNVIGTDGNNEITATSDTKYIEAKEGNDTIDLTTSHSNVKLVYDFTRGDGHDTLKNAARLFNGDNDTIHINIGKTNMTPKFRADGWDLILEMYANSESTENPDGSIRIKNYFFDKYSRRINEIVIHSLDNNDEKVTETLSISEMLADTVHHGVINPDVTIYTNGNDVITGTADNDIIYTNGAIDKDTITSSAGDDTYYLTAQDDNSSGNSNRNARFTYTVGDGDDVIYNPNYMTYLTLNYNNEDISMEFRKSDNNDIRMVFFDYEGNDRGSITVNESDIHWNDDGSIATSYGSSFLIHGNTDTFFIKKNNEDEGTAYKLNNLVKQYTDMGGSLTENNDTPYIRYIRITPETADGYQINNSGKIDRLIFDDSYNTVTGSLSGNDLILTYGDNKTVIVKGYATGNSRVYDVKVNGEYTTLGDLTGFYYGTTGDDTFIHSTEDNVVRTYNLNTGNDTVEFTVTPNRYNAYTVGTKLYNKAVINSQGGSQYTDTIKLEDYNLYNNNRYADTKLNFGFTEDGNGLVIKGERDFNPTTNVNYHKYTDITYNNFMSDSSPNLKIQMGNGDYSKSYYEVHKYNTVQNLDTQNSFDYAENTARVLLIKSASGTSNITSGSFSYSQIITTGGADLNFTGHAGDIIVTNSTSSNDTYKMDYSGATVFITDKGGSNDILELQNMYDNSDFEKYFLSFNVNENGSTDDKFAITYSNDGVVWNTMTRVHSGITDLQSGVIVVDAAKQNGKNVGIEHVYGCKSDWDNATMDANGFSSAKTTILGEIDMESWYSAVKTGVVNWMNENANWMADNHLNSTADVFNFYNNNSVGGDKAQSLTDVYESYNASMYLKNQLSLPGANVKQNFTS